MAIQLRVMMGLEGRVCSVEREIVLQIREKV